MLISSSRRKFVLQGLSAIAGAATFIRPSRAQAPAAPSGVASKLAPGPSAAPLGRWRSCASVNCAITVITNCHSQGVVCLIAFLLT